MHVRPYDGESDIAHSHAPRMLGHLPSAHAIAVNINRSLNVECIVCVVYVHYTISSYIQSLSTSDSSKISA